MKTVLFFGIYDQEYSRNRILMSGFAENGWNVIECRVDPKIGFLSKYLSLYKRYRQLKSSEIGIVFVAFPGQTVVWMAKILFRKKIIFDMFLSLFDSNVYDRKAYTSYSLRGIKDYVLDWYSSFLSDVVLLDTDEHITYISKQFHISAKKMIRVPIGADMRIFHPIVSLNPHNEFIVHFHGLFIPLQGIEYILGAAKLLRDKPIRFQLVGSGQEYKKIEQRVKEDNLTNVTLVGRVSFDRVPEYIAGSDICLGIFGSTNKTARVIPNKVYEYMAMNKPVITADTPAVKEFFHDKVDIFLCTQADSASLANTIETVCGQKELATRIAQSAYMRMCDEFSACPIVQNLIKKI